MKKKISSFYFLGAGRPHYGDQHSSLLSVNKSSKVIDWTLHAIKDLNTKVYFVCGYKANDIKTSHPDLNYIENEDWEDTKAGWSLLTALPKSSQNTFVSYSDIVFNETVLNKICKLDQDIIVTIDSKWRSRYSGRDSKDLQKCEKVFFSEDKINLLGSHIDPETANAEFIGLVYLSKKAIQELNNIKDKLQDNDSSLRNANLSFLIELLRIRGFEISCVDIDGDWAQLNEPQDLAKFILGTKAQTLNNLKKIIKHSRIEDQISFSVRDWKKNHSSLIKKVQKTFRKKSLIVRSSAISEDGFSSSSAGMYTSVLDIKSTNSVDLKKAVNKVIKSYPDMNNNNEVLVQPMLNDVLISGVVFTRGLQNGTPYYTINYDDITGSTESITSGTSQDDKHFSSN